jgi:hypothetical protein
MESISSHEEFAADRRVVRRREEVQDNAALGKLPRPSTCSDRL